MTAERMPAPAANGCLALYSFSAGSMLLVFAVSILLVASASFALGFPLSRVPLLAATGVSIVYAWSRSAQYARRRAQQARFFGVLMITVGALCGACLFASGAFYDLSFDGQAYHQEAIIQLKEGWNPYAAPTLFPDASVLMWVNHYPKGPWINAAALYAVTNRIEYSKVFNLLFIIASFWLAVAALAHVPGLPHKKAIVLALLVCLNPVSVSQVLSFYVDGQMASLQAILASLAYLWLVRADRLVLLLFVIALVLTIDVKFTGLVYAFLVSAGVVVWSSMFATRAMTAMALYASMAAILVGVLVVGYNPYVTNVTNHGHIFYPLNAGKAAAMAAGQMPANFRPLNRFDKMFHSLFSESQHTLDVSRFKAPFTVHRSELAAFRMPDVRVGGFGPLFGGALILAALILVRAWPRQPRQAYAAASILFWILLSAGINPEAWWARWAPQLWLLPAIALVVGFCAPANWLASYASYGLAGILIANIVLTAGPYLDFQRQISGQLRQQLEQLASRQDPPLVSFHQFMSNRVRLREARVGYLEIDRSRCAEYVHLISSTTRVCTGGAGVTPPPR